MKYSLEEIIRVEFLYCIFLELVFSRYQGVEKIALMQIIPENIEVIHMDLVNSVINHMESLDKIEQRKFTLWLPSGYLRNKCIDILGE